MLQNLPLPSATPRNQLMTRQTEKNEKEKTKATLCRKRIYAHYTNHLNALHGA
jgi:hypothetical protein